MARVFYEEINKQGEELEVERSHLLTDDELAMYTRNVIRETLKIVANKSKVRSVNETLGDYSSKRHSVESMFGEMEFTVDKNHILNLEDKILKKLLY